MQCRYCGAVNDPGKKNCVLCGKTMARPVEPKLSDPEPEAVEVEQISIKVKPPRELTPEEHIRIGELIYAAYKHKEAGSIEDAILACQGALALNDSSAASHALLGSLYESKGDIPSAIYQYEKVQVLDPGNVANLQKLDSMRKSPAVPVSASDAPGKKKVKINLDRMIPYVPHMVGAFAFVLVLLLLLVTVGGNRNKTTDEGTKLVQPKSNTPQTTAPVQPFQSQGRPTDPNAQPYLGPGQVQASQKQNQPAAQGQSGTEGSQRTGAVQVPVPKSGVVTGQRPIALPAVNPQPEPKRQPSAQSPVITPVEEQPRPAPKPAPSPAPKPAPSAPKPAQPAADPEERAMQLQGSGRYQEAIGAYRDALNRTSDSGRIHQQIAICQQRLGQRDQATSSYKSAIRSYRDQLSAGRDPSEVQRNIRSCEAGIEVLSQGR